ncbi:hypothetical protein C8R44DRAFT_746979 [Mycena epipterygia]|nr:hypothetical protein C8R44DRAFT_746979 [Mycena epipterygia]
MLPETHARRFGLVHGSDKVLEVGRGVCLNTTVWWRRASGGWGDGARRRRDSEWRCMESKRCAALRATITTFPVFYRSEAEQKDEMMAWVRTYIVGIRVIPQTRNVAGQNPAQSRLIRKTSGSSRTTILQGTPTGAREENGGQDSAIPEKLYEVQMALMGKFGKEEDPHFARVLIAVNFARNFGLTDFARDFDPQHCAFAGSPEFPQWRKYEFGVSSKLMSGFSAIQEAHGAM